MSTMQPLHDEHQQLRQGIGELRLTADAVGVVADAELADLLDDDVRFLAEQLVPHAYAEEIALYPVVEWLVAPGATTTMRRDHMEISALTEELQGLRRRLAGGEPGSWLANDLRRVLYGAFALVRVHFAKEEEVYLPLLEEGLTRADAAAMFAEMHAAAHGDLASHVG